VPPLQGQVRNAQRAVCVGAGKGLSKTRKQKLEKAKEELRALYGKD
jgi:hypothetical protein